MIGDNTSANVGYFNDLRTNTLKANGLTAVVDEMYTPPLTDATTLVQKVRSARPEFCIMLSTNVPDDKLLLDKFAEYGLIGKLPLIGGGGHIGAPELLNVTSAEELQGLMAGVANWPGKTMADIGRRFVDRTKEPWFGHDSIGAYAHVWILAAALEQAGAADRSKVTEALHSGGWDLDGAAQPRGRRLSSTGLVAGQEGIPAEGVERTVRRPTEQANVIIGSTSLTSTDPRRFTLSVLNAVLGGGMSSRLFQEIRERRGLAYSTYSFASGHADTGVFGLYAGCTPGKVDEVVALMVAEWERMADAPITQAELERSMGQLAGGLVLGMEDSGSRMSRLGKSELVHGSLLSIDESLDLIRAVTVQDVQDLAAELASRPRSVVRVGPFGD